MDGHLEIPQALRIIRVAQRKAGLVLRLLRELGDTREYLPLSRRFRSVKSRIESAIPDPKTAGVYGRLTLAVHDLNLRLAEEFYPGQAQ